MPTVTPIPPSTSRRAFALVLVLLMIVLLTIVLVALFSLLRGETRSSGDTLLRNMARQNALAALDLALGQVQSQLGPDQRISATAEFLDSQPATTPIEGVSQPHWTGVWDSYAWTGMEGAIAPTYNTNTSFRQWLVSTPEDNSQNPANRDLPKLPALNESNSVILVGKGTAKPKDAQDLPEVRAWRVTGDTDSTGRQGHYAWWVGDQGVKAKVNLPKPATASPSDAEILNTLASAPRNALEAVQGFTQFQDPTTAPTSAELGKTLTYASLPLAYDGADFSKGFHDFTVDSRGVLSDVQHGGLKKDLTMLLELPEASLPTVFRPGLSNKYAFNPPVGSPSQGKVYYRKYTWGANTNYMGPDWGLIYRYYNLWKSPYLYTENGGYVFYMDRYNLNIRGSLGSRDFVLPQTLRFQYVFGFCYMSGETYEYPTETGFDSNSNPINLPAPTYPQVYLTCYPDIQIWNPYNITLRSSTQTESNSYAVGILKPPANIWNFPSPPGEISFDGGSNWRPFLDPSKGRAGNVFEPNGASMTTNWAMHGNWFQIIVPPGTIRTFGIQNVNKNNPNDPENKKQRYYQGHYVPNSTNLTSPKRANDLINMWNSSNYPYHSNLLVNSNVKSDLRIPYTGQSLSFMIRYRTQDLEASPLTRNLFYEGDEGGNNVPFPNDTISRFVGNFDQNTKNVLNGAPPADADLTYKTITWGSDPGPVSPSSTLTNSTMAFSYSINVKAYPSDIIRKSKFSLFSDPLEKSSVLLGADATNAHLAPFEINLRPINGSASTPITYYPSGAPAVQVDSSNTVGYFGDLSDGVSSNVVIEFPTGPMTSLVQLQNVALGRDYAHKYYTVNVSGYTGKASNATNNMEPMGATFFKAVGNSVAHPSIPPDALAATSGLAISGRSFDHSFYANNTFFDSYFLSGMAPEIPVGAYNNGTARPVTRTIVQVAKDFLDTNPATRKPLPVARILPSFPAGKGQTEFLDDLVVNAQVANPVYKPEAYRRSAGWLMTDGAFNVNSTSVDAWVAMLSGSIGQAVPYLPVIAPTTAPWPRSTTAISDIPFLRFTIPNNVASLTSSPQSYWNGFRTIKSEDSGGKDIRTLATKLVEQVKLRGPFRSLAEFVNRQVSSNAALNQGGALQTAIDATGINDDPALSAPTISSAEVPAVLPNSKASVGPMAAGSTTYITQADILKPIAGSLSARSDTFVIRTYGEVTSKNGNVLSRSWCEAVVQRTPEFVDQTDPALIANVPGIGANPGNATPIANLNSTNKTLGRRFRIVQLRWLTPEEV